jgi:chemotaxis protein methyltransferase CheR
MNPVDYDYLCEFLLKSSGLSLGANKEYLLEARLIPLAQSWSLGGVEELVSVLQLGGDARLAFAVTEAMTTNETSFFRDKNPFDEMRNILIPSLLSSQDSQKKLRIWCAACSTGQEPYSILMLLKESFPELANWDVQIVATDLSQEALDKANAGIYSQFEVQRGLPIQLLMSYFEQVEQGWKIKIEMSRAISWRPVNLLDDLSHFGKFDIIFCRNVLIYFDQDKKLEIMERLSRQMHQDSFLLLGAAETALGLSDRFRRFTECSSAVYVPTSRVPAT